MLQSFGDVRSETTPAPPAGRAAAIARAGWTAAPRAQTRVPASSGSRRCLGTCAASWSSGSAARGRRSRSSARAGRARARTGGRPPRRRSAPRRSRQRRWRRSETRERPQLTLPAGCFPQGVVQSGSGSGSAPADQRLRGSGSGSASAAAYSAGSGSGSASASAQQLWLPTEATPVHGGNPGPSPWSRTLSPAAEDPDGIPDTTSTVQEDSPHESGRGRQWRKSMGHTSSSESAGPSPAVAPRRSGAGAPGRTSGSSRLQATLTRRRGSFSSMWSHARSVFGGSNASKDPAASQSGATSAMDMIQHDAVRSYDLRPFWRSASPSQNSFGAARSSMYIASQVPWPVRRWLSQFDWGPSLAQLRAKELVSSSTYEVCVMVLIVANSIFLGYQVEHEARTRQQLERTLEIEAFFCTAFALELAVKIYAMGWSFWSGSEASWNYFDIFVVVSMLLDFFVSVSQKTAEPSLWSQVSGLRIFRVLRVVRFLRSVRQLKFFMQLRIMIRSIMFSLRPLLWASIVLMGMFYVFGIILTQGVIDSLKENDSWDDESSAELRSYFGTLECAALSLFQAMSGGINWGVLFATLSPLAVHFRFVFLFFVLFAIFGATGLGIFVEIANHWARNDKASQEQAAAEKRIGSIKRLHDLFMELDPGGHGTVTFEGMLEAVLNVDKGLVSSFHALELEVTDVRTLFLMLDRDRKGYINLEEFLLGCFRLKGEAKTLDIMKLQYQSEWIMHNIANILDILTSRDIPDTWRPQTSPRHDAATPTSAYQHVRAMVGTGASTDFRKNFPAMVASQQLAQLQRLSEPGQALPGGSERTSASLEGSLQSLEAVDRPIEAG
ncbi:unnamed protein product [Prorocentrum cordatum]|uniref:EF-hand domain-containing protein n=1 Tax=Prorocentrum cordatum TaxID=2364126 RepID=A0ABN9S5W9_9DINO|nr:unnamed protein product [Polarella glacialis]